MYAQVIKDQRDATNGRWDLPIQLSEQGNELFLPLPQFRSSVDLASPRIKGGKQVEGSCSFVLVLQARRRSRSRGKRRGFTRARLQIGLFINTQHHFPIGECASVEINDLLNLLGKLLIMRHFGGEPQMRVPRLEFMVL